LAIDIKLGVLAHDDLAIFASKCETEREFTLTPAPDAYHQNTP